MRKRYKTYGVLSLVGILVIAFVFCGSVGAKDWIQMGYGVSMTGVYAPGATGQIEAYDLWLKKVNEKGGIYVKQYGKKLPVKMIKYDDKSSSDSAMKIYERLITQDKVDLVLGPYSTAIHYAIAPMMERYKMPLICTTAGTHLFKLKLKPEWVWVLDAPTVSDVQSEAIIDFLKHLGVKTVAVIVTQQQYPIEMHGYLAPGLLREKFDVVLDKDFPFAAKDHTALLMQVKEKNPDAFLVLCYPADAYTITAQIQEVGFNPKVFFLQIGPCNVVFKPKFGPAVEGISGIGRYSVNATWPGVKEFYSDYSAQFKRPPDSWASTVSYASCEVLEQAIEKAGTLDHEAIRKVIQTSTFQTICGPAKFEGCSNVGVPSLVIQYVKGEIEIVWPTQLQTAKPLYPKPVWPK